MLYIHVFLKTITNFSCRYTHNSNHLFLKTPWHNQIVCCIRSSALAPQEPDWMQFLFRKDKPIILQLWKEAALLHQRSNLVSELSQLSEYDRHRASISTGNHCNTKDLHLDCQSIWSQPSNQIHLLPLLGWGEEISKCRHLWPHHLSPCQFSGKLHEAQNWAEQQAFASNFQLLILLF